MPLAMKLWLAVAIEVLYAVSTRAWLPEGLGVIEEELWITTARLLAAAAFWWLFRDLITSRVPDVARLRQPAPWLAVGLALLSPVLVGAWDLPGTDVRIVFALTSLAVAVHEEFVYRGVLQNWLERHLGWVGALLVSNVVFTLYHYGAWPFEAEYLSEFFVVGCLLGLLYRGSGSLLLVVALHAIYDAVWCFTPLVEQPLAWGWGTFVNTIAVAVALAWVLAGTARNPVPPSGR